MAYYIELLESINKRSSTWKVDFSEVELLTKRLTDCISGFSHTHSKKRQQIDIAFSFRVCIGSKVLDIASTPEVNKLMQYEGSYSANGQNTLSIQFQIGDITMERSKKYIFLPVVLFDGKTDYIGGDAYFGDLCKFLIDQYDFVKISGKEKGKGA